MSEPACCTPAKTTLFAGERYPLIGALAKSAGPFRAVGDFSPMD